MVESRPDNSLVVAYLRHSSGDQDLSCIQQEAEIRAACNERGWILTRIFQDEARPGSTVAGREGFQEMFKYLSGGGQGEKGVVIWRFSRLARDIDDSQYYKAFLRRKGFEFYSLKDNIPEGSTGRLLEGVLDWMNMRFLEDLRVEVKRGMGYVATTHHAHVYGKKPMGYKRVPVQIGTKRGGVPHIIHRLEPDPDVAPLVTRAFRMRADGRSIDEVHREVGLYRSMQGYTYMFRNVIYLGRMEWADIVVEDFCPPLVDRQTWLKVQEVNRAAEARFGAWHPRRQKSRYMLSGFVRCGSCGRPMGGLTASSDERGTYSYYGCTGVTIMDETRCKVRVRMEVLDARVMRRVGDFLTEPAVLREIYADVLRVAEERQTEARARTSQAQKGLDEIGRKIGRVVGAISEYGHSQAMLEELAVLERERDRITAQLSVAASEIEGLRLHDLREVDAVGFAGEAWRALQEADGREKQLLLRSIIDEVVVEKAGGEISGTIKVRELPGVGWVDKILPL